MKRSLALCGCLLLPMCLWAAPVSAQETGSSLTEPATTVTTSAPTSPSTEPTDTTGSTDTTTTTGHPTTESTATTTKPPAVATKPTTTTTKPPAVTTKPLPAGTTAEPENPTTKPLPPETTVSFDDTFDVVMGTGTTALSDGYVAVSPLVDNGVLRGFGLTIEDFDSRARLLIPDSQYDTLSGVNGAAIRLNVRTSARAVSAEQIRRAVGGVAALEGYAADTRALTVELSLQSVDTAGGEGRTITDPANTGRVLYTVQLPVPESMRGCAVIGVALADDSGLRYLNPVPVTAGVMEFRISCFGSFTILGFGSVQGAAGEPNDGGLSPWVIAGLVLLGLLLVSGALWLYVTYFRPVWQPAFFRKIRPGRPTTDKNLLIMAWAAEEESHVSDEPPDSDEGAEHL